MASCGRHIADTLGKRRLRERRSHSIGGSALEAAPLNPFLCRRMGQGRREMERGKMTWLLLCTHLGEVCNISFLSHAIHIPPYKASQSLWSAFRLNWVKLPLFCKQKMLKKRGLRPYGNALSLVPLQCTSMSAPELPCNEPFINDYFAHHSMNL